VSVQLLVLGLITLDVRHSEGLASLLADLSSELVILILELNTLLFILEHLLFNLEPFLTLVQNQSDICC
jgi:hypothetical protein